MSVCLSIVGSPLYHHSLYLLGDPSHEPGQTCSLWDPLLTSTKRAVGLRLKGLLVCFLFENNLSCFLQELYRRYLYNPDTWTVGLQKHLKKSIIREKTNKFSSASHQYPLPVYRPKALLTADKMANGAPTTSTTSTATTRRRILSANYPAASARVKTRVQSAASTMSRFRAPPPLV